jgi:hypothetical protein
LGVFGVAVDRERSLTASPIARVETDDHPDLPDSERSLPERSSAALRSPLNRRRIPISRAHPYSYRDSYRDERTSRLHSAGSGKPSTRTFASALGGTRIPNLLIRRCRRSCRIVPHRRVLARPERCTAGRLQRRATACDALGRVCWLECWLFCRQGQGFSVSSSREFVNPDWSHCGSRYRA